MGLESEFRELLGEISSSSPAPGGGSVAALSGALGASLVSMACRLTIGKKKYEDVEEELKDVLGEAEAKREELLSQYSEDMDAFKEVMAAYRIEGNGRKKALRESYRKAAEVPLETARKCLRVMELARIATKIGNRNAITDLGVGALMGYSGVAGAALNVKVNLKHIEDGQLRDRVGREITQLEKDARDILDDVIARIESHFSDAAE